MTTISFIILGQVLFNAFFVYNFYISEKEVELREIYDLVTEDYSDISNVIYSRVSKYEDEINLRVFIYSDEFEVVYETLSNQITSELVSQYSLSQQGLLIKNFMITPRVNLIESYRSETKTLAIRGTMYHGDSIHYIILEIPLASIEQAVYTLNNYTIRLSIVLLILGAVIAYGFSNRISSPITSISKVAKKVANLDFSLKAPVGENDDEINILARNINFMAQELESSIEELKVANESLQLDNELKQEVDTMRKEFIANISHELKTPLAIMQGYTEMLKDDVPNIDKDFYFDVILDENRHMTELVSKLLNVSKLENGVSEINPEEFELCQLCEWIVSKNEPINENIDISFVKHMENAIVCAEKINIEQVIKNFISNAYNYAETYITVDICKHDDYYRVAVYNDGESISDEDLKKIWHSFYRADKARTRNKDKNFGLGLYIVKTIISQHDGKVGAYNTDEGVCFWFELKTVL
ncbi:MAG: HAMP domain-containing sensor histidine kinase [Clostridia bacterium]